MAQATIELTVLVTTPIKIRFIHQAALPFIQADTAHLLIRRRLSEGVFSASVAKITAALIRPDQAMAQVTVPVIIQATVPSASRN